MSKGRQLPSLWLARTSTNLLPCTENLILFLREYMMQNHPNKLGSLSTTQWLSEQVSHIFIRIHVSIPPLISRYTSLNKVIRKGHITSSSMSMPLLLRCIGHSCCPQTHSSAHQPWHPSSSAACKTSLGYTL